MSTSLTWKKSFLSSVYQLFSNNEQVGWLENLSLNTSAEALLNNKKYLFTTTGFFSQTSQIREYESKELLATITYNSWHTKAIINYQGKNLTWINRNLWNTKFQIFDSNNILIDYKGSSSNGTINSNVDDDVILLTGLFVNNYYWQTMIGILVAVMVPIYFAILN